MDAFGLGDSAPFDCYKEESIVEENSISLPKFEYNIYGILNFLQTEWSRMSIERSRWEYDKAALEAKIELLQNEKKGHENLKNDLVRRIKMLEYALKQERFKNLNIKQSDGSSKSTSVNQNITKDMTSCSERARLRHYLDKMGMSGNSSELRAIKVKELLQIYDSQEEPDPKTIESALAGFSFLSEIKVQQPTVINDAQSPQKETDTALAEFDNLVAQQGDTFGENSDIDPLHNSFTPDILEPPKNWGPSGDQSAFVDRLKKQYQLGLPVNGIHRPKSAGPTTTTQTPNPTSSPPPHAFDEMELFSSSAQGRITEVTLPTPESILLLDKSVGHGGLGDLANLTSASALDNLDGVVQQQHQSTAAAADDSKSATPTFLPAWVAKYTLRSHFDAIRAVVFHHSEQILITGSEDCTLRLWSLSKRVQAKKSSCLDVEPMYTCRGHTAPVLCLALLSVADSGQDAAEVEGLLGAAATTALETNIAFSGSLDGEIRSWRLGSLQFTLYDNFDPGITGPLLKGHTDAVWSLVVRSDGALLSASADGTVQLWYTLPALATNARPAPSVSASRVYRPGQAISDTALPTSVAFLHNQIATEFAEPSSTSSSTPAAFVAGLTSGDVVVMGLHSGRRIHRFEPTSGAANCDDMPEPAGSVNAICVHPSLPMVISAHENRQIRFLDTSKGVCVAGMVAHLEGVHALSIDPQGIYLLSASHDSSIRLWDVESRTCVQEFTSHRKKHDESVHSVAFHPTQPLIASAGADGLAKVYA